MNIKCPKCGSDKVRVADNNFAYRKEEGQPAKKTNDDFRKRYCFCLETDCGHEWQETV